jgi:hypothetical protein
MKEVVDQMKKSEWLTGLGLIGACALCCALPIIGGVAALGISSFFLNPIVLTILAFVLLIAGVIIYKWRKSKGLSCLKPGCKCNSCATH